MSKPFPTPSNVVIGEIPEGADSIKVSKKGAKRDGPTEEFKFSNDNEGPHKVEAVQPQYV